MALVPGTKLGPYEIVALLGAGGMGEVYRARDTRLQRTVAIKILPAHLSSNPELHARFEQEDKAISGLQHPRIKVCVLALGGLEFQQSLPEVDPINFITRVQQPVLMLNGRYDFLFPVESNQEPFYRLLGSKKEQKKHLLYDTGHNIPRNELIKETLNWQDQYLGPVN